MESIDWFNLDDVELCTVDSVNGYIRKAQQLFADLACQNGYYNIPMLVNCICMKYLMKEEKFSVCGATARIQDKQRQIVHSTEGKWSCAFGNVPIKFIDAAPMEYEWKFKANYPDLKGWILYGIWAGSQQQMQEQLDQFVTYKGWAYCLHVGVSMLYTSTSRVGGLEAHSVKPKHTFQSSDIITMRVNTQSGQLIYLQNDELFHTEKIDTQYEYRMVVSVDYEDQQIELLSFKQTRIDI